jgi:hypothetical protein
MDVMPREFFCRRPGSRLAAKLFGRKDCQIAEYLVPFDIASLSKAKEFDQWLEKRK